MITAADITGGGKAERVVVTRPFLHQGKRQEVGTVLTVPRALSAELRAANKAERAPEEAVKAPEATSIEKSPTPKRESAKKEAGHAGQ